MGISSERFARWIMIFHFLKLDIEENSKQCVDSGTFAWCEAKTDPAAGAGDWFLVQPWTIFIQSFGKGYKYCKVCHNSIRLAIPENLIVRCGALA